MKSVKMSLVNRSGQIVNEWEVPFNRRNAALEHAMDRAEQEGHAGVLWAAVNDGKIREIAFDSHDPEAMSAFARSIKPFMTQDGLDIDLFLGQLRSKGVTVSADVKPI